jgi:hypothetical protein
MLLFVRYIGFLLGSYWVHFWSILVRFTMFHEYGKAMFTILVSSGRLNNFTFVYEIKNTWTEKELYEKIESYLKTTGLGSLMGRTFSFTMYYGTVQLSVKSTMMMENLLGYSFHPEKFTLVVNVHK